MRMVFLMVNGMLRMETTVVAFLFCASMVSGGCVYKKDAPSRPADVVEIVDLVEEEVCTPDCEGRQCGPDGCGGVCGECEETFTCNEESGACECAGVECGGLCCGADQQCFEDECCDPGCEEAWVCGEDACGNSCGGCGDLEECVGGHYCVCVEDAFACDTFCCQKVVEKCVAHEDGYFYCCAPDCTGKVNEPDGCGGCCGECCITDGACDASKGENCDNCPGDCGQCCGNGKCEAQVGENLQTCPSDCEGGCGDGYCAPGESMMPSDNPNIVHCPYDCCGKCGDGICATFEGCGVENATTCGTDCAVAPCGDGSCEKGENPWVCEPDCTYKCGDGICGHPDPGVDEAADCPADCVGPCGDCECEIGESNVSCPHDCPACGDKVCAVCPDWDEKVECPADCEF